MSLVIAMPPPWLPESGASHAAAATQFPELPALGRMLGHGRRMSDAASWRTGVLSHLTGAAVAIPPVAVAARALPGTGGAPLCLAAPLHVVAGISRVHLPPDGRLVLDTLEEQAWCAAFNQEFGSASATMHIGAAGGGWLLQAPFAAGARDAEPDTLAGEVLARQPALSEDERLLRRLGTEVEMWLAAHELNREREARRVPVLNAIWFWDGGRADAVPPVPGLVRVASNRTGDVWLTGLARHATAEGPVRAARWDEIAPAWADVLAAESKGLIVLSPEQGTADGSFWQMVEERWIAPLAASLPLNRGTPVLLQIGARAWQLPDRRLLRWIRPRRRPWWQLAGQVRA